MGLKRKKRKSGVWVRFGARLLGLALALAAGADLTLAPADGIAGVGKAAHMNVAVFHVWSGKQPAPEIKGDEVDLLTAWKGSAQMLGFLHTTGMKDGDVVMLQGDVMRGDGASSEDFGVDCELIVHVKNGEKVTIAGKCDVLVWDVANKRQVKQKMILKPTEVGDDWTLVGWDKKEHIAIYVNEEIGAE